MVTCVDKANVFRSLAFFRKIFYEVAERHADIAAEACYIDAMSLYMVQAPWNYDVLVMENMFGDILSMMLDWLGERNGDADASMAARRIESAVAEILRTGEVLTPDLGGKATTAQMGDAILKVIESGSDTPTL